MNATITQLRQSVAALKTRAGGEFVASSRGDSRSSAREEVGERASRGQRGRLLRRGSVHDDSRNNGDGGEERARRGGSGDGGKWERLQRVQRATHKMLERLDKVVSEVAAAKV
jgi:hypothetical protein